jgi:hypothetical protein
LSPRNPILVPLTSGVSVRVSVRMRVAVTCFAFDGRRGVRNQMQERVAQKTAGRKTTEKKFKPSIALTIFTDMFVEVKLADNYN